MPSLFKVVLNGTASGQDVKNSLAYRVGVGVDPSIFPRSGAEAVAEQVLDEVVPAFLALVHESYMLETIDVYCYNEQFSLKYTAPYSLIVNLNGGASGECISPASNITFKANLEPMLITETMIAPRRGWLSVGPLSESFFENGLVAGALWTNPEERIGTLATKLKQNLESLNPPFIMYPVRLKQNTVLGINTVVGYADIQSWAPDRRLKIRKSRQYPK